MTIECDILVVGAGPAGCSAAFFLKYLDRDNKLNVTLIERLPKDKFDIYHRICGEGVSEDCFKDISPIKPSSIVERIKYVKELWPGGIEIMTKASGYILDRSIFLKDIIDDYIKMNGNFELNNVSNFLQDKEKVCVKFSDGKSRKFDYVIAADGANSIFRKYLGIRGGEVKPFVQYIIDEEPIHDTLFFYYDERYVGDYKWVFPNGSTKKIGFPLVNKLRYTGKFIEKQSRVIGYGRLEKFGIGRILLVGDAACQTNPITKGGIRSGMVAARIAAEAIIENNPGKYEKRWVQSTYASALFSHAYERLRDMDNSELSYHIKPFGGGYGIKGYLISRIFYRKYGDVYRAYELSRVGW